MASIEEELWNIFSFYTLHGYPRDPSQMNSSALLKMCRDVMLTDATMTEKPMTLANLNLIFTAQVAETNQKKKLINGKTAQSLDKSRLNYDEFLSCLMKIALKCYPRSSSNAEEAMQHLLMDNILPMAHRRKPLELSAFIMLPAVESLYSYYSDALMDIFKFYATASDHNEKKKNMMRSTSAAQSFDDQKELIEEAKKITRLQNSLANHVGYSDFIRFAGDFGFSSMGLTILELGDTYLTVIAMANFETNVRKMNFREFWEALVRCALLAFKDVHSSITTEDKVKGMFLYIWRHIQSTMKSNISSVSNNTYKGGLIRGSQILNERFITAWTKDHYRDYLDFKVTKICPNSPDSNMPKSLFSSLLNNGNENNNSKNDKNKEIKNDKNQKADKIQIEIDDNDYLGDERIKPSHLRTFLQLRPDIASLLHGFIDEAGIDTFDDDL